MTLKSLKTTLTLMKTSTKNIKIKTLFKMIGLLLAVILIPASLSLMLEYRSSGEFQFFQSIKWLIIPFLFWAFGGWVLYVFENKYANLLEKTFPTNSEISEKK